MNIIKSIGAVIAGPVFIVITHTGLMPFLKGLAFRQKEIGCRSGFG